jgi:glucose/arabinose dehydrogenase
MKILLATLLLIPAVAAAQKTKAITGQAAFADWNQQVPGTRRLLTIADLPAPNAKESVRNPPQIVPRPALAWPIAPPGFKVTLYAGGDHGAGGSPDQQGSPQAPAKPTGETFRQPRLIRTAPNGDLFLADSGAGIVYVLRGIGPDGRAAAVSKFASGLDHPFGIAFYPSGSANPTHVYVANTTTVVRFPYKSGDVVASAPPQTLVPDIPGYAQLQGGGHWTRDIVFSQDNKRMLISVGSGSNVDDPDTHPREFHRADVLAYTPEGKFLKIFASGLRNCVGEAINPTTGALWCSTNERDGLGNHLVPDYVTSVPEDGFFGWPWFYMGGREDPRLPGKHPELKSKVITPDVLVQPHMASLQMTFYPATGSFPEQYHGDAFAAEHGSWNRANRAGYEVIRIPMKNGHAEGGYEDFLTGFVVNDEAVWGRPVGVTIGTDGSMYVVDDGSRSIWHITYTGN